MADEAKGKGKHVGGKIKEGVGELLGDSELEREGRLDQAAGRAEQDEAKALEDAREARERKLASENAKRRN